MTYRLKLTRQARAEIDTLPGNMRQRIRRTIAQLAENPRPDNAKALRGELRGYYRVRIEAYRIIYTVNDDVVVVAVVRVAKRSTRSYDHHKMGQLCQKLKLKNSLALVHGCAYNTKKWNINGIS